MDAPRPDVVAGYDAAAETLIARYEALDPGAIYAAVASALPPAVPTSVLDIGAGTGRDAAWLAGLGCDVLAVEPAAALRAAGQRLHPSSRIGWCDDRLPHLGAVRASGRAFGLVLVSGVLQHLRAEETATAWDSICTVTRPGGTVVLSLRHGPGPKARPCYTHDAKVMVEAAEESGLTCTLRATAPSIQAANRRANVTWTWLVLTKPAGT